MTPPNAPKAPCETCKSTDWHNLIDGRCWPYCGHTAPTAAERAGEELMPRELRSFYAGEARRSPEMTVVPVKEWMDAVRRYEATVVAFEFALRSAFEKRDAARRERETAYETTAQVRDALSEEILKLRDHLAAARRENETANDALRKYGRHLPDCRLGSRADYQPQAAYGASCSCGLAAALAAAHGEDR